MLWEPLWRPLVRDLLLGATVLSCAESSFECVWASSWWSRSVLKKSASLWSPNLSARMVAIFRMFLKRFSILKGVCHERSILLLPSVRNIQTSVGLSLVDESPCFAFDLVIEAPRVFPNVWLLVSSASSSLSW